MPVAGSSSQAPPSDRYLGRSIDRRLSRTSPWRCQGTSPLGAHAHQVRKVV